MTHSSPLKTAARLAVSSLLVAAAVGAQARDKVLHLPIANALAEPAARRNDNVVWNADESRRIGSVAQLRGAAASVAPKDEHQ